MLPVLLEGTVGGMPVTVPAYPLSLGLAAIVALALLASAAGRLGVRRVRLLAWGLGSVLAGLVGARALAVLLNLDLYVRDPWLAVEPAARGFALYGGALAALAVMAVAARRLRLELAALADASVVPFAAGLAIVRVGCFLAGCCAGIESDLPWAVAFPSDVPLGGILGGLVASEPAHVHPTQLYELVAVLVAAWASGWLARRIRLEAGGRAAVFAVLFLGFRAVDQLLREPSPGAVLAPELVAIVYAVVAVGAVVVVAGRSPRRLRRDALAST